MYMLFSPWLWDSYHGSDTYSFWWNESLVFLYHGRELVKAFVKWKDESSSMQLPFSSKAYLFALSYNWVKNLMKQIKGWNLDYAAFLFIWSLFICSFTQLGKEPYEAHKQANNRRQNQTWHSKIVQGRQLQKSILFNFNLKVSLYDFILSDWLYASITLEGGSGGGGGGGGGGGKEEGTGKESGGWGITFCSFLFVVFSLFMKSNANSHPC